MSSNSFLRAAISAVERGHLPDALIRFGIRRLCHQRRRKIEAGNCEERWEERKRFIREMAAQSVAPVPEKANEQHYELPPEFFALILGAHRKYSSCFWPEGTHTLDEAEARALEETCRHACLEDGQDILELGCGWGSLTLWMAERYPASRIVAVSNSSPQRDFILGEAGRRGLANVRVVTADMNDFDAAERFDRVVSVEMFEHMRNYGELLERIDGWLRPGGKLFIHIFCHHESPYVFETASDEDWMGRYFFTGGIMPSDDLLHSFQDALVLEEQWRWSGVHYEKTANEWLRNMDRNRERIQPILEAVYGAAQAPIWRQRWRVFFMACAELFGLRRGEEWWVSHYLMTKRPAPKDVRRSSEASRAESGTPTSGARPLLTRRAPC